MDTIRSESRPHDADVCVRCGVDYGDQPNWSMDRPHRQTHICSACTKAEQQAAALARSVPCAICGGLVDPEGSHHRIGEARLPVHWECRQRIHRAAPFKAVVEHRWREKNWRTRELWYVLQCWHWYPPTTKDAKRMRCHWCAEAAAVTAYEERQRSAEPSACAEHRAGCPTGGH